MALMKAMTYADAEPHPMEAAFAAFAATSSSSNLFGIDTRLTADFVMPAPGATADAQVGNSAIFTRGQRVFLADIGWLEIVGGSPSPKG